VTPPPTPADIHDADASDHAAIVEIFNHYVKTSAVTFETEPFTVSTRRELFEAHAPSGPHRLLVATDDGNVLGFASSRPFQPRPAYARTIATSIYLRPDMTGRGFGSMLYSRLFDEIRGECVHRAIAGITVPNDASQALHTGFGFTPIGVQTEVGYKFDKYWDVLLLERTVG
jgi:phosphinothricin acetyltransferase